MNVRHFGDLADILIEPTGEQEVVPEGTTTTTTTTTDDYSVDGDVYEDEFEDDFEEEGESGESNTYNAERDDHVSDMEMSPDTKRNPTDHHSRRSINSFDVSRSEDSSAYFQEEDVSEGSVSVSASGSDSENMDRDGGNNNNNNNSNSLMYENEAVASDTSAADGGAGAMGRVVYFADEMNVDDIIAAAPAPAPVPPSQWAPANARPNKLVAPVAQSPSQGIACEADQQQRQLQQQQEKDAKYKEEQGERVSRINSPPVHIHLPNDTNSHPVPSIRITSSSSSSDRAEQYQRSHPRGKALVGEGGIPLSPVPSSAQQTRATPVVTGGSSGAGVRGPIRVVAPCTSHVQRVDAWNVPGSRARADADAAADQVTHDIAAQKQTDEKQQVVLTVLELLQRASRKAEASRAASFASKNPTTIRVHSADTGGLSKAQAMAASGKFFMGRVKDYDPDFDAALPFMRMAEEERVLEQKHNAQEAQEQQEAELLAVKRELEELKAVRAIKQQQQQQHENNYKRATGSSFTPLSSRAGTSSGSNAGSMRGLSTYPGSGSGGKENATPQTLHTHPGSAGKKGYSPQYNVLDTPVSSRYSDSSDIDVGTPSASTIGAMAMARGDGEGVWGVHPLERRADALGGMKRADADALSDSCEKLYATFLSDVIINCRQRAMDCKNTEEMAMLKALSDHVTATFAAGDRMEDVQCKMLRGAREVQKKMGSLKVAEASSPVAQSSYSQRLLNPYRNASPPKSGASPSASAEGRGF